MSLLLDTIKNRFVKLIELLLKVNNREQLEYCNKETGWGGGGGRLQTSYSLFEQQNFSLLFSEVLDVIKPTYQYNIEFVN